MPCRFILVGAMNLCPCGQLGRTDRPCPCTPTTIANYRARLSGPLLDRFEVQVEVPAVPIRDLREGAAAEPGAAVAARVAAARRIQEGRFAGTACLTNSAMPTGFLRPHARLDEAGRRILDLAIRRLGLSARAHDGILRVARVIADLEACGTIGPTHVAEAVQYRTFDRQSHGAGES